MVVLAWQWHWPDCVQTICTSSLLKGNDAITLSLFHEPDPLPGAQPTVSEHWRQLSVQKSVQKCLFLAECTCLLLLMMVILLLIVGDVCVHRGIPINGQLEVSLDSDGCRSSPYSRVVYLEHVQAVVTLAASRRGEVEVFLTSPQGTRSTLLARRIRDASTEGFNAWAFMTTHCWGEFATGTWRLEVRNGASTCKL